MLALQRRGSACPERERRCAGGEQPDVYDGGCTGMGKGFFAGSPSLNCRAIVFGRTGSLPMEALTAAASSAFQDGADMNVVVASLGSDQGQGANGCRFPVRRSRPTDGPSAMDLVQRYGKALPGRTQSAIRPQFTFCTSARMRSTVCEGSVLAVIVTVLFWLPSCFPGLYTTLISPVSPGAMGCLG